MIGEWTNAIHCGDAFDVLPELPDESVHACVSDPPYGLAFMGRDWDDFEPKEYQEWCEEWAREVKRVLKPGGHLLAFSGNRTHHRLFTGVEDAGFEVRDTLTWHYGNGFPKNSDTHLKPATEFVVLARKQFPDTAARCFEEHSTAYLNIEACRVGDEKHEVSETSHTDGFNEETGTVEKGTRIDEGRYPANVVFGEQSAADLDEQVGELSGGAHTPQSETGRNTSDAPTQNDPDERVQLESGGPSRYFYTSKASRSERTLGGSIENAHPTVKPQDLMEWLVQLVTRDGQIVLDPFAGSGTTCKAAKELSREFVGIERQEKWADVARVRCNLNPEDPSIVRADNQAGVEEF